MIEPVIVKVLETSYITHDVKRFVLEKPPGCDFIPGQSINISINLPEWKDQLRPFTFTSLPEDNYLEFMIKIYLKHNGVTNKLDSINADDELILHDIFGVIQYKSEGVFIAAGSGITPFISIFRNLYKNKRIKGNTLIYSNKTADDVMMEEELQSMLGNNFIKVFTRQNVIGFIDRRIDRDFLIDTIIDFNQHFYICGPDDFVKNINTLLLKLGASAEYIVIEQ
ncbi:MAG: FAD-binding oxidoreductase [Bacteroidia bacterium]